MPRFRYLISLLCVVFALFVGATAFMPAGVYSSAVWFALWALVAVALCVVMARTRMWRLPHLFVMHAGMVLMLAGGGITALTSQRGTLHLRPSQPADVFVADDGRELPLPATLTLQSFYPEYYQGMSFPKDFHSEIIASDGSVMSISMNRIGRLNGYRFYQTSFDNDGGTVLTVSHDPAGIAVVYLGFFLFAIGGAAVLLLKLLKDRSGSRRRSGAAVMFVALASFAAQPLSATPAISEAAADSLSARQVLFNGRTVPFNTAATLITLKLTGRMKVGAMSPERFVGSVISYGREWSEVPFIRIKSGPLRRALDLEGEYVSLSSLYDGEGNYRPGLIYKGGGGELDDAILRLDEKVAILAGLWKGELFTPADGARHSLRSDFSVRAEIAYNRLMPVRLEFICSMILVCVAFAFLFLSRKRLLWKIVSVAAVCECGVFVWLWYVTDRFPVSDVPQIMQFMGTVVTLLTVLISYRGYPVLLSALTLLIAAFLFLVSWLGFRDPQLSPLMPVLASPWLAVHVSIIMAAYAVLGLTFPAALVGLIVRSESRRMSELTRALLLLGTYLLAVGIIIGAMWANVSWGRYWAWDPKETWALVTLMLYSLPLHRCFSLHSRPKACHIYMLLIFTSIIMTYAGVNCLSSLHAYN